MDIYISHGWQTLLPQSFDLPQLHSNSNINISLQPPMNSLKPDNNSLLAKGGGGAATAVA
jgi:hypothetical protein